MSGRRVGWVGGGVGGVGGGVGGLSEQNGKGNQPESIETVAKKMNEHKT